MRNNPTLIDYRIVLTLTENGSFRAASEALAMSPSALSRQLAALEAQLGTRLFDRDTRNVATTESGKVFARLAERMLNTAADVLEEFDAHLSTSRGRAHHRRAAVRYREPSAEATEKLHRKPPGGRPAHYRCALGQRGGGDRSRAGGYRLHRRHRLGAASPDVPPLLDDHFVAVGEPEGPLAEDRPYEMAELMEMPVIAMENGTSVRELLDGACQRSGFAMAPRFEVAHLATAGALVAEGLGIAILPTLTLSVLPMERLIKRPVRDFGAKRRIGLVHQPGRSLSPSAAAFLEHAKKNLPDLRQSEPAYIECS